MKSTIKQSGFTLIELSIVLVIIGLIIGGILTGQDLINAAAQRAQISQIEKYNTAVRTFQNKYGGLPGDLPNPYASLFGFTARGTVQGQGDGDGIITGSNGGWYCGTYEAWGETAVFWVDLSQAGLIDGGFNTATELYATSSQNAMFPAAKIGQGNYVYVWSEGPAAACAMNGSLISHADGFNYFGISTISSINAPYIAIVSSPGITVQQAYNIDKKTDDGLPQSGTVVATYAGYASGVSAVPYWAGTTQHWVGPYTSTTDGTSTSCFDNSAGGVGNPGVSGATQHYSIEMNSGGGMNCALSFRFQ